MKVKKTKTVIVRADIHIIRDFPVYFAVEDGMDKMPDGELQKNAVKLVKHDYIPAYFVPKADEINVFSMGFLPERGKRKR